MSASSPIERERMDFDVLIVGAGPAGLATACRLAQLAQDAGRELNIAVLEKGAEVGAHIVSGALLESSALDALFPDWRERGAPVELQVQSEDVLYLTAQRKLRIPDFLVPSDLHNAQRSYLISLGNLCRWLAQQAEALGVNVLTGFAGSKLLFTATNQVEGVQTGDLGLHRDGTPGANFTPGYALHAAYTVLAEGCRGQLGKEVIAHYGLDAACGPQHYALGIKEIWEVAPAQARPGHVLHTLGWPLSEHGASGGGFLYHQGGNKVAVGLFTDLNYANPWLSPYEEFQRYKQHPVLATILRGGKRLSYGARASVKGGLQALPKLYFPGGILVGDAAGFLNTLKLKGVHTAMHSGLLAAEALFAALQHESPPRELVAYQEAFAASALRTELHKTRNVGPALHKLGTLCGAAF
ncbi:MAG: NAD(P)/FAD-dependent oxidoreductase, partial [Pseudomonadales bacterium]|nr:NAD(P)/FAD-dependent oxidoreductase [Pseudomonadales bacterium]